MIRVRRIVVRGCRAASPQCGRVLVGNAGAHHRQPINDGLVNADAHIEERKHWNEGI